MPLPILFIGIAATTGSLGIGKSIKAGVDASAASKINRSAQELVEDATKGLEWERKACGTSLEQLGQQKLFVLNSSIQAFLQAFSRIKNVDFRGSEGLEELKNFHIDSKYFAEMKSMVNFAGSMAGGAVAGTASGALVAFGAYGAAQALATASTGTAIASLSGAAATNATLAFFGGGSMAAGGLGMMGGTAVLGSLVAGPALMVMGFVAGSAAKKSLEKACTNREQAIQISQQLNTASLQCQAIRRRTYLYYNLLARLDAWFLPLVYQMEDILKREGEDYRSYSAASKKAVASCASLAVTIKTLLDTPILTEEGELTETSAQAVKKVEGALKARA